MKERSREMGSSRRTAEEIFRDYSGRRTDAVHDLTNETEVEQGFVHFDQLGLPPTFGKIPCRSLLSPMSSYSTVHVRKARAWFFGWGFQISRGREAAPLKHKHYRPAGKKKEGNAVRYVTRSQAVKQLQVSLPLFS
ncbi:pescadillo-like protein [Pyrus ussuriensis x Pyrus communis]|uniref:Pescadillo-like protein n=1 Tax=Pyrus ussuriensis x Pyrus communis TaxID=2448454 RepID=A0A5N5GE06_9ROSA|nr:pescadillo-like protein [Pyrus ussuriensis x Pyrus communis]